MCNKSVICLCAVDLQSLQKVRLKTVVAYGSIKSATPIKNSQKEIFYL